MYAFIYFGIAVGAPP